ncbi:DUF4386 domain-containing protein [Maribellus maritimus]|uniref:DUF4386 domain-containing protein n=1 Tax=Maribellus maritimus TaxID=2870838 RepID=UPI001EE9BF4F|nr:DUF4386 domain-containing protein [Maribellus maritimus]MCG6186921.1 DUF4386 domain-containing protein [Maribellus maritimus]
MKTIQSVRLMKTNARTAGVLYLIIIITGLFSELFVRSGIIVPGNATATADNIAANSFLFRIGFISDLIMVMSDVGVALLFYLLLKSVNQGLSMLAAFFRLAQATVLGINLLNFYLPLLLLGNGDYLSSFNQEQLNSLSMVFLNAHSYGYLISGVFFGISCIILGTLIFKAAYFPKWLGTLVVAAGVSYLIDCVVNFLFPEFASTSEILVMTVAVVSELSLCLFLLIKGVKSNSRKLFVTN